MLALRRSPAPGILYDSLTRQQQEVGGSNLDGVTDAEDVRETVRWWMTWPGKNTVHPRGDEVLYELNLTFMEVCSTHYS